MLILKDIKNLKNKISKKSHITAVVHPRIVHLYRPHLLLQSKILQSLHALTFPPMPMCMSVMMMVVDCHVMLLLSLTETVVTSFRWSEVHLWLDHWMLGLSDGFVNAGETFVVVKALCLGVGAVFGVDYSAGLLVGRVVRLYFCVLELAFEGGWDHLHQDTVLKNSAHDLVSCQVNLSLSILNAILPLSLVKRPISPKHFSIALSLIVDKITLVEVTTWKV